MKLILRIFLISIFFINFSFAEIVEKINVKGNQRITKETVVAFGSIEFNKNYNSDDVNEIIKRLYKTDFFETIKITIDDKTMFIELQEKPVIQNLDIRGVKSKKILELLQENFSLKSKGTFSNYLLKKDTAMVKSLLTSAGYYFVDLKVLKTLNDNNSVDLIYDINLGEKSKIYSIEFIGNKFFKDRTLKRIITSEEDKFWKFISSKKFLNEERISLDKRLLTSYYKNKGFYKVNVVSNHVVFDEGKGFKLTFNIESGKRYMFGDVKFDISDDLDKKYFSKIADTLPDLKDEHYSMKKMSKILEKITSISIYKNLEFINSTVKETVKGNKVDIIINIEQLEKFYVERINILGNTITKDNVIRSAMITDEGDPFNYLLLNKSVNNIKSKRLFAKVEGNVKDGSQKDLKIIEIEVEEKPTGELSAGAGAGTSGTSFQFGVKENNWLGNGISLEANVKISDESLKGKFAVTNPNYNYSGNAITTSLESTTTDKLSDYGYKTSKTGIRFNTFFEQYEDFFVSPTISIFGEKLDTNTNASTQLRKQDGSYFDADLQYSLVKDKRNQKFQPTDGFRYSFTQKLPLYSDGSTMINGLDSSSYYSFNENFIGSFRFYSRAATTLSNNDDVRISDRIYIPSRYLRGFEYGKIGPKDSGDYIGGNYAAAASAILSMPNAFTNFQNTELSWFFDAGNVWGVDYNSTLSESSSLRSSMGLAVDWVTPVGPFTFSYALPITKDDTDKTESVRFNIGTTF